MPAQSRCRPPSTTPARCSRSGRSETVPRPLPWRNDVEERIEGRWVRNVLFISGTCSALGPDFQQRHNMPLFQHAEMAVISDAGHRLFVERFDAVLAAVRSYLHAYAAP